MTWRVGSQSDCAKLTEDNADDVINTLNMPDIVTVNRQAMRRVMSGYGPRIHWTLVRPAEEEKALKGPLPTPAIGTWMATVFPRLWLPA